MICWNEILNSHRPVGLVSASIAGLIQRDLAHPPGGLGVLGSLARGLPLRGGRLLGRLVRLTFRVLGPPLLIVCLRAFGGLLGF